MADNDNATNEIIKSAVDTVKGKVKETFGAVANREHLEEEGRAQKEAGQSNREAGMEHMRQEREQMRREANL